MEKSKQKFLAKSKTVLLEVPALLDITKLFYLYVDKKEGVAKGVITQSFKPWKRAVVYPVNEAKSNGNGMAPKPLHNSSHGLISQGLRQTELRPGPHSDYTTCYWGP